MAIKYPPVSIECGIECPPVSQTLLIQGDNLSPCIIYRAFLNTGGSYCTMCTLCSGAVIAIIALTTVWCMLRRRRSCCKMDGGDNTAAQTAMPTAPTTTIALLPPSVPPPTTLSPSMFMNEGPPTDIELALFRIQEKERQRHLHHLHQQQQEEMQRRVENLTPGIQQYPVA